MSNPRPAALAHLALEDILMTFGIFNLILLNSKNNAKLYIKLHFIIVIIIDFSLILLLLYF